MKPLTIEWIEKAEEDWVMMLKGGVDRRFGHKSQPDKKM